MIEVKVKFNEVTGVEILNKLKTTEYPNEEAREYFVNSPSTVIRNQGREGIDMISDAISSHESYTKALVGDKVEGDYLYAEALETFNKWPTQVVEKQSVNVDVVSGATYTDHALNGALAQCLTKAGLNPDDYK